MTSRTAAHRARFSALWKWHAPMGAHVRRSARVRRNALAVASGVVGLALTGVSGTTALWTGAVTVNTPAIQSGSVSAALSGFGSLAHTYTAAALSKTGYMVIGNSGSSPADYTVTISAGAGSSLAMANKVNFDIWLEFSTGACTNAAPVGAYSWSGKVNPSPVFTGSLPPNTTGYICVRSRADAELLSTTATLIPAIKIDLVVPGTRWTSTSSAKATQNVVADPSATSDYTNAVFADGANRYWRLGEQSGQVLYDWVGYDDAFAPTGLTRGSTGALAGDVSTATAFPDDASGMAGTRVVSTSDQTLAVEAWFKTTSTTGGKIVGFGGSSTGISSNNDRHIYLDPAGRIQWGVWPDASRILVTTGSYNDGQWHHVVGNLGPAGQELYVDGTRVGTDPTTTSALSYPGYWRIGGDNTWAGDYYFDGVIDEVAIYDNPISATQVKNHWNLSGRGAFPAGVADPYGSTVYGDTPALFWRLGESSGIIAADSSPNARPGTYSGNVSKPVADAVIGTQNTAASFGGTDGMVASTQVFTDPQVYSLELWFNTTTTTGGKLIGFGNAQTGTSTVFDRQVYLQNDGKLVFGNYNGSIRTVSSTASYNDGAWHHMVATLSGAGMVLYVDGVQVAKNSAVTSAESTNGYWRIGGDSVYGGWPNPPSTPFYTGRIDEVAVYGTALSDLQVKRHYAAGTGVPMPVISVVKSTGLNATFSGVDSFDTDGTITSYLWDFGDGTTSTDMDGKVNYTAPGTYTVKLTVTDSSGKSNSVTRRHTAQDVTAPTVPGTPTVVGNTGTSISLSWTASTDDVGVTQYEILRAGIPIGTSATTSYTDRNLNTNTPYDYSVRAKDAAGNTSAASGTRSVTTLRNNFNAGAFYSVTNSYNGKCLRGGDAGSGDTLRAYTCAGATNQNFQLVQVPGSGGYFAVNSRAVTSMAWDVAGSSMLAGARVKMATQHLGNNQQWLPIFQSTHSAYQFMNRNSGMCLQVVPDSTTDGLDLQQATCSATTYQYFTLRAAP